MGGASGHRNLGADNVEAWLAMAVLFSRLAQSRRALRTKISRRIPVYPPSWFT